MTKLTKRQQEILTLIQSHMNATGSPPTRAEIAKTMGFRSPNAAEDHLRALARKGVIELVPGTSRGIRLTQGSTGIPIVRMERLSPNLPLLSENHLEGTCRLDRNFFQPGIDYLLHMNKGNPELGILEHDYLAIHQAHEMVTPGQLMLIRVHQEVTLRRYSHESPFQPSSIEGLVIGVIRNLTKHSLLS